MCAAGSGFGSALLFPRRLRENLALSVTGKDKCSKKGRVKGQFVGGCLILLEWILNKCN